MRRSSLTLPVMWLLALATVVTFSIIAGCEKSSDPTHLDNPFDPASDAGGDGLQIRALPATNKIFLTWNQPQNMDIIEYFIYRSDSRNGDYEEIAIVPQTALSLGSYTYETPSPTQTHWFKAQAFTTDGRFTLTSLAVPASIDVGPTVVVGDDVNVLATRYPVLTVTVGFGDSLLVSLNEDFTDALRLPAGAPGVPVVITSLDLGPTTMPDTFTISVKSFDLLGESIPTAVKLPVSFNPLHTLIDANNLALAERIVDLAIPSTGVVQMRFALSQGELAAAQWMPAADTVLNYELADTANPQEIWGEYEGDFGFNTTHLLGVRPDLLGGAAYRLKVPDSRIVSTLTVVAELSAHATDFRLSESPTFTTVPWQAMTDTTAFQLSGGEGTKTVYAQYRNDWTQSAILSDYCIYITQGPDVKILVPGNGSVVLGGSQLTTRGTSYPGTGVAQVDTIGLDLGDGQGFRPVFGTDTWQKPWSVPTFTTDTELVLRARVRVGDIIVTDAITVTVTQLAITTLGPIDGAAIVGGEPVNIAGTASGILGGALIDSVTVDIGAERMLASGAELWTTTWLSPVVATDTDLEIIATVWAGGESTATTTAITLTP